MEEKRMSTKIKGKSKVAAAAAVICLIFTSSAFAAALQENDDITIGKRVKFRSEVLNEERTLEVYLPGGYAESGQKYPVLIALDGGWFFRYCVSLIDMMSPNYFPEMIIFGLPNTDRRRDLDPLHPQITPHETGTGNFQRFLKEELFPYIDKEYRTRPYRILAGHSKIVLSDIIKCCLRIQRKGQCNCYE